MNDKKNENISCNEHTITQLKLDCIFYRHVTCNLADDKRYIKSNLKTVSN